MSRVLVVDDDRGIREMLRAILELEGFEVELAGGGAQALALLTQAREPWVVLMDVMMPGLSGVEVCGRLREAGPLGARHRVALMTAGLLPDADCPLPARTILRKPFELDAVVELVSRLTRDLACERVGGAPGGAEVAPVARTLEAAHAAAF
jgi:two-component system response regulator MprA